LFSLRKSSPAICRRGAKHLCQSETGAKTTASNSDVLKFANVLILATKPDQVPTALAEIRENFTKNHLLISIAAGVTLSKLENLLPAGARVIRVMPNTPALVGEGGFRLCARQVRDGGGRRTGEKTFIRRRRRAASQRNHA
jgi:pyrroline-5-carboxylate reductase